jgi:hypothetical protein
MAIVATRTATTDLAPLLGLAGGRRFAVPTGRSQHPPAAYLAAAHHVVHFAPLLSRSRIHKKCQRSVKRDVSISGRPKVLSCPLIPLELIFDEGILRAREIS